MNVPNAEGTNTETPNEGEEKVIPPEEGVLVSIGAEPTLDSDDEIEAPVDEAGTPPTQLIKDLRTKAREDARKLRTLEAERDAAIAKTVTPPKEPAAIVVGDKPTLEACEYDAEKYGAELLAWNERVRLQDQAEQEREKSRKALEQTYADRLTVYKDGATALKVPDFAVSEKAVEAGLATWQQSIIVKHAKNSALVVYALGRDAAKLKELGAIKDPVEFGIQAALLEGEIKTVKKSEFRPEGRVTGGGTGTPAVSNNALDKAREKAAQTGDFTEVHRLKKEQKAAAAKKA